MEWGGGRSEGGGDGRGGREGGSGEGEGRGGGVGAEWGRGGRVGGAGKREGGGGEGIGGRGGGGRGGEGGEGRGGGGGEVGGGGNVIAILNNSVDWEGGEGVKATYKIFNIFICQAANNKNSLIIVDYWADNGGWLTWTQDLEMDIEFLRNFTNIKQHIRQYLILKEIPRLVFGREEEGGRRREGGGREEEGEGNEGGGRRREDEKRGGWKEGRITEEGGGRMGGGREEERESRGGWKERRSKEGRRRKRGVRREEGGIEERKEEKGVRNEEEKNEELYHSTFPLRTILESSEEESCKTEDPHLEEDLPVNLIKVLAPSTILQLSHNSQHTQQAIKKNHLLHPPFSCPPSSLFQPSSPLPPTSLSPPSSPPPLYSSLSPPSPLPPLSSLHLSSSLPPPPSLLQSFGPSGEHYVLNADWKRETDGRLTYHNAHNLSNQKKVAAYLLKRIGSNLLKGKSIMSVSLPIMIFDTTSFLERLAYSFCHAPRFLERAGQLGGGGGINREGGEGIIRGGGRELGRGGGEGMFNEEGGERVGEVERGGGGGSGEREGRGGRGGEKSKGRGEGIERRERVQYDISFDENDTTDIEAFNNVLAFYVTLLHMSLNQIKPFNPILGETLQCRIGGCPVFFEQVSHHPPISAFLLYGKSFIFSGSFEIVASLGMNSMVGKQVGTAEVKLKCGRRINFILPTCIVQGGFTFGTRFVYYEGKGFIWEEAKNLLAEINFNNPRKGFLTSFLSKSSENYDKMEGGIYRVTSDFWETGLERGKEEEEGVEREKGGRREGWKKKGRREDDSSKEVHRDEEGRKEGGRKEDGKWREGWWRANKSKWLPPTDFNFFEKDNQNKSKIQTSGIHLYTHFY